MMIAAIVILGFTVVGMALSMFVAAKAPVGYQDEKGFHFGPEQTVNAPEGYAFEGHPVRA